MSDDSKYDLIVKELYTLKGKRSQRFVAQEIYTYISKNQWKSKNVIQVAGTCGKGSVSHKLAAVLQQVTQKKVGLFTSPHILDLRERIQINNVCISKKDFVHIYEHVQDCVVKHNLEPTMFDILTVIALIYFQQGPLSECYKRSNIKHSTRVDNYANYESTNLASKSRLRRLSALLKNPLDTTRSKDSRYSVTTFSCNDLRKNSKLSQKVLSHIYSTASKSDSSGTVAQDSSSKNEMSSTKTKKLPAIYYQVKNSFCGYVVLETGLGGRFDPTNMFGDPIITIITSIGLDHQKILGNTIEEIAAEKAGIIKRNVSLVLGPKLIDIKSIQKKIRYEKPGKVYSISEPPKGTSFTTINSIIASTSLDVLLGQDWKKKNLNALSVNPPFRLQFLSHEHLATVCSNILPKQVFNSYPKILLDVGHNVLASEALAEYLDFKYSQYEIYLLFGLSKDRNINILQPFADILGKKLKVMRFILSNHERLLKFEDLVYNLDKNDLSSGQTKLDVLFKEMQYNYYLLSKDEDSKLPIRIIQNLFSLAAESTYKYKIILVYGSVYIIEDVLIHFGLLDKFKEKELIS